MERRSVPAPQEQPPREMGVYRVCHKQSGRWFVGASLDVPATLTRERFQLEIGTHPNPALQREWKRLGPGAFAFETVATLAPVARPGWDPKPELRKLEAVWRQRLKELYGAGYNDETSSGV